MVSIKNKNSFIKSRKFLVCLAILTLLIGSAAAFTLGNRNQTANDQSTNTSTRDPRPLNTVDYSPATNSDNKATEDRKDNPKDAGATLNSQKDADFSVMVTQAAADNANQLLRVRTLVNGATGGTCQLKASRSGQPDVIAASAVTAQNNTHACGNFDIPFSQFPQNGEWRISVNVTNGTAQVTGNWPEAVNISAQ